MAKRVPLLWSGTALDDLRSIRDYVSRDRPQAARRLARRLQDRVVALRDHPELGRTVPELPRTGYREVQVPPYRIVYEVVEDRVVILRVWDARRSPEAFTRALTDDD